MSCCGQKSIKEQIKIPTKVPIETPMKAQYYYWYNLKYINCLKDSLPCECAENLKKSYFLLVDTNSSSKTFGAALSKYSFMETNIFPIKKIKNKNYEIISNRNDNTVWARMVINGDSIMLYENDECSVFYKKSYSNTYDMDHYMLDNIDLLNKSLHARGYPNIQKIVNHDSLRFECNKEKGNVNMLSIDEKPLSWILEIRNDSLFIDKVTYSSPDPDPDDIIIPQKFKAYKW